MEKENKGRTRCLTKEQRLKNREKNKRYYYKNREEIIRKQSIYIKEKRKDIAKTKEELSEMGRDEFGRFKITNGASIYKRKQRNGRHTSEHVLVWEDHNNKILPEKWCVHHINENKRDNRIENLEAMPISKHTKMHFAEYYKNKDVWNKGKKCPIISEKLRGHITTEKQKAKCRTTWLNRNINRNVRIWELKDNGLTPTQISKQLNITTDIANHGFKRMSKIFDTSSGRLK